METCLLLGEDPNSKHMIILFELKAWKTCLVSKLITS